MRTLRCKCGECIMWTTDSPSDCQGCKSCNTTYAGHPDHHKELQPHTWKIVYNENTGLPYNRCEKCSHVDEETYKASGKRLTDREVDKMHEAKVYDEPAQLYVPENEPESSSLEELPIPKDLDEAIEVLATQENIEFILKCTEKEFLGHAHHGFGTGIRNNWGLWRGSVLAKWFKERGIHHADDMSGIILTSSFRKAQGKDIDLEGQIKFYRDFWEENCPDVNIGIV